MINVCIQKKPPLLTGDVRSHLHPSIYRHREGFAAPVGQRVDLASTARNRFGMRGDIAALLELAQHRVDSAFGGCATTLGRALHFTCDLIAVHGPLLQHAQDEELGQAHLDDAAPIQPVGIVHRCALYGLEGSRRFNHERNYIPCSSRYQAATEKSPPGAVPGRMEGARMSLRPQVKHHEPRHT